MYYSMVIYKVMQHWHTRSCIGNCRFTSDINMHTIPCKEVNNDIHKEQWNVAAFFSPFKTASLASFHFPSATTTAASPAHPRETSRSLKLSSLLPWSLASKREWYWENHSLLMSDRVTWEDAQSSRRAMIGRNESERFWARAHNTMTTLCNYGDRCNYMLCVCVCVCVCGRCTCIRLMMSIKPSWTSIGSATWGWVEIRAEHSFTSSCFRLSSRTSDICGIYAVWPLITALHFWYTLLYTWLYHEFSEDFSCEFYSQRGFQVIFGDILVSVL